MGLESIKNRIRKAQGKAKTAEEARYLRENVKEVKGILDAATANYNSPEARAKREAEYMKIQVIGALRKAAYELGEPMSNYPLPWEKEKSEEDDKTKRLLESLKGE